MGQVASDLSLQNRSAQPCGISGYPAFTLYSAAGAPLPTHIFFEPIPVPNLVVRPGGWVHAELRYSSNIPSDGEPMSGPCEPKASYVLVTVDGGPGTVRANLDMAQPICGRGWIQPKSYASGASS